MADSLGEIVIYFKGDDKQFQATLSKLETSINSWASGVQAKIADAFSASASSGLDTLTQRVNTQLETTASRLSAVGTQMQSASSQVQTQAGGLLSGIGGMLQVAGGNLLASGIEAGWNALSGSLIGVNSQLESSTLQFQTLTSDAGVAEAHVKSLFDFAKQTPFETGPIIEASRFLETFGGSALNTTQNLTMVGDAAAATGNNIAEVSFWTSRAYDAMMSGKPFGDAAASLQQMGVLSGQARNRLEDLQKSGASGAEIWAAYQQELGKFAGAMQLQANTWAGLTSSLSDAISLSLADMSRPLFNLAKDGLGALVNALSSASFETFVTNATGAIQRLADFIRSAASGIGQAWTAISPYVSAGLNVIAMGASTLGGYVSSAVSVLGELLNGAMGVATGINDGFTSTFDGVVATLAMFGSSVLEALAGVADAIANYFGGLAGVASSYGDGLVSAYASGIAGAVGYVADALSGIADTVTYWLEPHSPPNLLPNLDTWGADAAEVYMGGWQQADFDALSAFGNDLSSVLGNLVSTGALGEGQDTQLLAGLRVQFMNIINEAKDTGKISSEALGQLREAAGPAGDAVVGLAEQHIKLSEATAQLTHAQKALNAIQTEMSVAQAELAAAQASGNTGLAAEIRNRIALLKSRKADATQKQAQAQKDKSLLEEQMNMQRMLMQAQKEQLDLMKKAQDAGKKGGGGGGGAKEDVEAKKAAEAQWKYNYSLADTETKIKMLRDKQAQYNDTNAEFWNLQGQIKQLEEKRDQDAAKAAEQRADAEFQHAMATADTAGKVDLLRNKLAGLDQTSAEYWQTLTQLEQAEAKLEKEREKAAKGSGGGAGAPKVPGMPSAKRDGGSATPYATGGSDTREQMAQDQAAAMEARQKAEQQRAQVQAIIGGIGSAIASMIPQAVTDMASKFAGGLASMGAVISANGPRLAGMFGTIFNSIVMVAITRIQQLTTLAGSILSVFVNLVATYGAGMTQSFMNAWLAVGAAFNAVFLAFSAIVTAVLDQIILFFQNNGTSITATIATAWNTIMQIIQTASALIIAVVVPIFTNIANFIQANSDTIQAILTAVWNTISVIIQTVLSVIQGIVQMFLYAVQGNWLGVWQTLVNTLGTLLSGLLVAVGGILTALGNLFMLALQAIWSIVSTVFGAIFTSISNTLQMVFAVVSTVLTSIAAFFATVFGQIVEVVSTKFEEFKTAAIEGVNKTLEELGGMTQGFFDFGANLVGGVIEGLKSRVKDLVNAAKEMVNDALGGAQDQGEVKSPSRLFARELGAHIPTGAAMGVEQSTPALVSSLGTMVDEAANSVNGGIGLPIGLGSAALAGGSFGGGGDLTIGTLQLSFPNVTNPQDPAAMEQVAYMVAKRLKDARRGY